MKSFKPLITTLGVLVLALWVTMTPAIAANQISHAPESANAYILEPQNNAKVDQTFAVKFGLSGMGVAPAGVDVENTGHHHLLIDMEELPELDQPLPKSDRLLHFGGGQTETKLTLPPGKHTLQLVLGNYLHVPHDHPVISDEVTVTVK